MLEFFLIFLSEINSMCVRGGRERERGEDADI